MPRHRKYKSSANTLNTRYKNNPHFYNKDNTDKQPNYNEFLRKLRLEFRNLRRENNDLNNQLTSKKKAVEELNIANKSLKEENDIMEGENCELKEEIRLLKNSKKEIEMDMELLIRENSMLKGNIKKLKEQINVYEDAIKLYQNEIAMKISGQVKPEMDTFFLNFTNKSRLSGHHAFIIITL
jgi:chromosome segregation ATPase